VGTNWEKYSAWQENLRRLGMEGKGGKNPMESWDCRKEGWGRGDEWKREGQSKSGDKATHSFHAWLCADTGNRVDSEDQRV